MKECLLVGVGGMFGSVCRYLGSSYFLHSFPTSKFPWGTFVVNILGCLLIGVFAGLTEKLTDYNSETRLFVITGILGGFTTFSAFSIETLHLFKNGNVSTALTYSVGSVTLGVICAFLGLKMIS